jgi:SAM-dependent methyltransferase
MLSADAAMQSEHGSSEMIPFVSPLSGRPLQRVGNVLEDGNGEEFSIVDDIPRFVAAENYASHFGLEWTIHARTQLDSIADVSRARLERCLGTPLSGLRGKTVLEVGCGAGRFTEFLVGAGALVHAIDLSTAVDVNRKNIGSPPNYVVAQADLRRPPFPSRSFDFVIALGVLQHTPSPEDSVRALWSFVRPSGSLVIDHYTWTVSLATKLAPLYRLMVKRLPPEAARTRTDRLVDVFFPLHWAVRHLDPAQILLSRISPCLVYFRTYPHLSKEQHRELCRLDTFDSLTDQYKHIRTTSEIRRLLAGLPESEHIVAYRDGNGVEARAQKRAPAHAPRS